MLTKEEIKHLAELARLELTEEETEKYQKQLSEILDYMDILKKIDTSKIKTELSGSGNINRSREDEIRGAVERAEIEIISPSILKESSGATKDNFIKTKKIFE